MIRNLICILALSISLFAVGCGDDDNGDENGGTGGTNGSAGKDEGKSGDGGSAGKDDAGSGGSDIEPPDCDDEEIIDEDISQDTTWECPVYLLQGKIYVVDDAVLTIEPGVQVLGDTSGTEEAALIVTRGARLEAIGTADDPIVFSSGNPEGARSTGDWAGVALLGSASINSGSCIEDGDTSTADTCEQPGFIEGRLEGIDVADDRGRFGGSDDESDCGSLKYARIEFAGAELSPDNELNGLTVAGCGDQTELSHIQVHRGKDDGIEFFGGNAGMDHVVISGASDDGLDWDLGWQGEVQFLVIHQFAGTGDNAIEADNLGADEDAQPRSNPTISNVTMIGTPDTRGMLLREGTRGRLRNFIVYGFGSEAVDLAAAEVDLNSEWPGELSIENSFFFDNGDYADESGEEDDDGGFSEEEAIEASARSNTIGIDPEFGSLSETSPDYIPANEELSDQAVPGFGDKTATYAGAFEPNSSDDWTEGWTAFPEN
ncbi:MAG: hypothetical protein JXA30_06765 [Deltaproteobacteria bacterium]|nr:hypothetical protein [Deltaproteobacteria bacterium]